MKVIGHLFEESHVLQKLTAANLYAAFTPDAICASESLSFNLKSRTDAI